MLVNIVLGKGLIIQIVLIGSVLYSFLVYHDGS